MAERMDAKIDVTSSAIEKGIDTARDFLDKLIGPAAEEVGLLLRDSVVFWKFKNQVRMLNKAKAYCEKHAISPSAISLKLLCPLLDNAALEEDDAFQDKWAILLANMVDSEQNVQNHVFPYILGQLSTNEFSFLEQVYLEKRRRVRDASEELEAFKRKRPALERELSERIKDLESRLKASRKEGERWGPDSWGLLTKKRNAQDELRSLDSTEVSLSFRINRLQQLPDDGIEAFEMSNVIRLGLVRTVHEPEAHVEPLHIPFGPYRESQLVDVELQVYSNDTSVLTELGELFFEACSEKGLARRSVEGDVS